MKKWNVSGIGGIATKSGHQMVPQDVKQPTIELKCATSIMPKEGVFDQSQRTSKENYKGFKRSLKWIKM